MTAANPDRYFIHLEDGTEIDIDCDNGFEDFWTEQCEAHKGKQIVYHSFTHIEAEWLNQSTIKKLVEIVQSVVCISIPYWVITEYAVFKGEDYFTFERCENDFLGVYEDKDRYIQEVIDNNGLQDSLDRLSTAFFGHTADVSTFLSTDAVMSSVAMNNLVIRNVELEGDRFYLFSRH